MKKKYFNDAIIGNRRMIASISKHGELLRLSYPTVDYRQFIDFYETGVKINDSMLIKLENDINNSYKQYYIEDTNILNTEIDNTYFNLKILQQDFVPMDEEVLIRRYEFTNNNKIDLGIMQFHLAGIFSFEDGIDKKLFRNLISILYSYLRPIAAQISVMAKLPPLDLPILNFSEINTDNIEEE